MKGSPCMLQIVTQFSSTHIRNRMSDFGHCTPIVVLDVFKWWPVWGELIVWKWGNMICNFSCQSPSWSVVYGRCYFLCISVNFAKPAKTKVKTAKDSGFEGDYSLIEELIEIDETEIWYLWILNVYSIHVEICFCKFTVILYQTSSKFHLLYISKIHLLYMHDIDYMFL